MLPAPSTIVRPPQFGDVRALPDTFLRSRVPGIPHVPVRPLQGYTPTYGWRTIGCILLPWDIPEKVALRAYELVASKGRCPLIEIADPQNELLVAMAAGCGIDLAPGEGDFVYTGGALVPIPLGTTGARVIGGFILGAGGGGGAGFAGAALTARGGGGGAGAGGSVSFLMMPFGMFMFGRTFYLFTGVGGNGGVAAAGVVGGVTYLQGAATTALGVSTILAAAGGNAGQVGTGAAGGAAGTAATNTASQLFAGALSYNFLAGGAGSTGGNTAGATPANAALVQRTGGSGGGGATAAGASVNGGGQTAYNFPGAEMPVGPGGTAPGGAGSAGWHRLMPFVARGGCGGGSDNAGVGGAGGIGAISCGGGGGGAGVTGGNGGRGGPGAAFYQTMV